jgi:site-specific recombinase XerD
MKRDLFNHTKLWETWKSQLTPRYIEEGLTKENSKLYINYLLDMEKGINLAHKSKRGSRDPKTLNRQRSKIKQILKLFQEKGITDISKVKEEQVIDFFNDWNKSHSIDYAKRMRAFWNWWMTKNRREGKVVKDVTEDLNTNPTSQQNKGESVFVWLDKSGFDKFRSYFDEDKQAVLLFCFDTIIRAPTELLSLKVENIYTKGEEVWIDIPNQISKTFGRKFNLVYSGKAVIDYIKKHKKKPEDYLFEVSPVMMNREMQKVAFQLWDNKKSEGGEYYKNITLYDLRHSGAIHYRVLFQKTGQSLDLLRERGGWTDFKMINYYTKRLGLDGHIQKEKLMLQEDKTKLEERIEKLEKENSELMDYAKDSIKTIEKMKKYLTQNN